MNHRDSDKTPVHHDHQSEAVAKALEKVNARHAKTLKKLAGGAAVPSRGRRCS